jgi:PelA/Pel-15E family pectate lyase
MEAYESMIWLQYPGTISMGHLFLDAFRATANEYYYQAADKAARAVIWGQSTEGGWNYMIDFAGDRSLKRWYETIGKNGWRLEEFQHYYGNATFDDNITSDATRFLLRMYLEKLDPVYKPSLDKAIDFVLESQYEIGGWPQRYPLMDEFRKNGNPDYTAYYTFNDEVIYENINLLIQCYLTLGEERFLDPIMRGMNFMLIAQQANGAWGSQYNMELEPAGARTYEPKAYSTDITFENAFILLRFYQYTGDPKFLEAAEKALQWLEEVKLADDKTENGIHSHASYIDIETNQPIYVHRKGTNVKYGKYYHDQNDQNLLGHSRGKRSLNLTSLRAEYERMTALSFEDLTRDSPIMPGRFTGKLTPQKYYDLNLFSEDMVPNQREVSNIIGSLDIQSRWMEKNVRISHPFIGDGQNTEQTDQFASTRVGDETDTSPFDDTSDQLYISTGEYIRKMRLLINYLVSLN